MFASANHLPEDARSKVAVELNHCLADGLDLYSQIKTAHWNVRGPHFAALHELFDKFAESVADHDDEIAERAVALGALARGTVGNSAEASRLSEYPEEAVRDLEHVALLAERFEKALAGLRSARDVAELNEDVDTVDLLTGIVTEYEKHGWMLKATLEGTSGRSGGQSPDPQQRQHATGQHAGQPTKRGAAARA